MDPYLKLNTILPSLRFCRSEPVQARALVPVEEPPEDPVEPWSEPLTVEELVDKYIIESKFAGRYPGTTLYLTQAKDRSGALHQVEEGQRFKLFLVTWLKNSD